MLLVAGVFLGLGFLFGFTHWWSNPDPEGARYLLSAMSQVIGTVFVLTVAIMQAVGGSELMDIGKLVSRVEFKIAAGISFAGIFFPQVCLYFSLYCTWSAVCLGLSAANLLVIGWFVWRIAPEQAAAKSLSQFKKEALEKLTLGVPSEVMERIKRMAEIGKATKTITEQPQTTKDACTAIKDVTVSDKNNYNEIWKTAVDSLIEIDKALRKRKDFERSEEAVIPMLHEIADKSRFNESRGWPEFKKYLFQCLHDDIEKQRLDFDKPYDKNRRSAWESIKTLMQNVGTFSSFNATVWNELVDYIVKEFTEAIKSLKLVKEKHCKIIGLLFTIFCTPNRTEDVIQSDLTNQFKRMTNLLGITEQVFLVEYEACLSDVEYPFTGYDPNFKKDQLQKFKQRFLAT